MEEEEDDEEEEDGGENEEEEEEDDDEGREEAPRDRGTMGECSCVVWRRHLHDARRRVGRMVLREKVVDVKVPTDGRTTSIVGGVFILAHVARHRLNRRIGILVETTNSSRRCKGVVEGRANDGPRAWKEKGQRNMTSFYASPRCNADERGGWQTRPLGHVHDSLCIFVHATSLSRHLRRNIPSHNPPRGGGSPPTTRPPTHVRISGEETPSHGSST